MLERCLSALRFASRGHRRLSPLLSVRRRSLAAASRAMVPPGPGMLTPKRCSAGCILRCSARRTSAWARLLSRSAASAIAWSTRAPTTADTKSCSVVSVEYSSTSARVRFCQSGSLALRAALPCRRAWSARTVRVRRMSAWAGRLRTRRRYRGRVASASSIASTSGCRAWSNASLVVAVRSAGGGALGARKHETPTMRAPRSASSKRKCSSDRFAEWTRSHGRRCLCPPGSPKRMRSPAGRLTRFLRGGGGRQ